MSKSKLQMSNQVQNPSNKKKYDLEERTAEFGERIIDFAKKLPKSEVTRPVINQFIRSGTSVGANYMEADAAESKKDFRHKIGICKKESKETCYWMRMIARTVPSETEEARELWKESHEFVLIFSSIIQKSN